MIGLTLIRAWSSRFFHRFGIHCATHQIRLILISGLVITSLFYPALGIYSDSVGNFSSSSSPPVVGQLFGLSPQPLSDFRDDLDNVWGGQEALHILEDTVARARCGTEKTVRIERVLLTSDGFDSDTGAIDYELLRSALQLERELMKHLSKDNFHCLPDHKGGCLALSPLEFWSHDEDILRSDLDLLWTVNKQQNISVSGLPLRPSMVFAGRESAEPRGSTIDFAAHLALSFFFHEDDCNSSGGHRAWLNILSELAPALGEVPRHLQEPSLLALELNTGRKTGQRIPLITLTLYLSYIIFFVYFSGSMRRMDSVHSRIGLCFTGLVEILVSTITSLSVCAIFGLRITLVPWGIFPIVIVFVGAENMFRLVDDVTKTPISLPVKERIGIGLSRAGTSNTLKVVSYNAILGVIGFFSQGAIRQFCAFAIVVLVAHWFLIHTFFVAVLSIDIQRLELDDLLRQDKSLGPHGNDSGQNRDGTRLGMPSRIVAGLQRVTKGRLTKNFSLMLLLVITSTLYYSTLPVAPERHMDSMRSPATRASVLKSKAEQTKLDAHSTAREIWRVFNPDDNKLVHLRVEAPAIVVVNHKPSSDSSEHRVHRSRWPARTLRSFWWVFKVMVIPIGTTLSVLYGLLLYLLKGTDRLENHHVDTKEDETDCSAPIEDLPLFKIFPRTFASDVSILASNKNGTVLASVSSDGELFLWLASSRKYIHINTSDLVLKGACSSAVQYPLTAVAVDDEGTCCAVGAGSGVIGIWSIHGDDVQPISQLFLDECASPVSQIELSARSIRSTGDHLSAERTGVPDQYISLPSVIAIHRNGRVVQWTNGVPMSYTSSRGTDRARAKLIHVGDGWHPILFFFHDCGGYEIIDPCQIPILQGPIYIHAGSSEDLVVDVHACLVNIEQAVHVLVAAVTYAGVITLWDAATGECILVLDETYGFVNSLRILPIPSKACSQCGEVPQCSFCLVYSVGHIVLVDQGILAHRCSCPLTQPLVSKIVAHKDSSIGRRSRSGSFVSSSGLDTVSHNRSRRVSLSEENAPDVSAFPVSAHGKHARRGSEKEALRRGSDRYDRVAFCTAEDGIGAFGDGEELSRLTVPDGTRFPTSSTDPSVSCLWRNFRLVRVREATCERGGWDILNGKILGIRRKPRKPQGSTDEPQRKPERATQSTALSISVLDRWEVWMIDPSKPNVTLQASSLSTLRLESESPKDGISPSTQKSIPRLSFTRLSPLIIRSPICLAGFGNTVGMIHFGKF
ncbi:uncharacterized protein FOMMEDRAFT_26728 [Fomitiporia mediterranea MF3/22]|uniref:uncharacterized protein n=1 Tax=Fomitiporia mediterranea (strain MF3/22) TaxID=694068 RepID=UPI00044076D3|nr:uncharacterized protein FOMMEDRAFT_26728 [Fomitiporia mediterranea MF3/22]EJD05935.1 hypothetical protein FOMMEDRAFT_26728 [Fomitiporia mediterranea MF3/22]